MTLDADTPAIPIADADLSRLRRMKVTATGFLLAAAAVYAATYAVGGGSGVGGYVRAAAEAAMVGGLADWFAVTALFRRPLHLPIPHTAIIPAKKDEIAAKLGAFVTTNFLTPQLLERHLDEARVVARIGHRLRDPVTSERLGAEVAHAVAIGLAEVDADRLVGLGFELARRDAERRSYAPLLGELLDELVAGEVQRPLVELLAARAGDYLRDNRSALAPMFKDYVDDNYFWLGLVMTERRVDRIIDAALRELEAVERDPRHPLRHSVDGLLRSLATGLRTDGVVAQRVDEITRQMLADDRYQEPVRRFAREAVRSFRELVDEAGSGFVRHVAGLARDLGHRIESDRRFEAELDRWLRRVVDHAVREYGDELTVLIRRTVEGWDPSSASRRIEIAVGRDLQFIRINGTVVGAAAGLAIHAVTVALL